MKSLLTIFTTSLFVYASQDFPFIEPLSVEVAPHHHLQKVEKVIVQPPKDVAPAGAKVEAPLIEESLNLQEDEIVFPDSDNDGVFDANDKCPNTTEGFVVDGDGCPKKATIHVVFGPDQYTVVASMQPEIKKFADFLKENKGYQVLIYGYTDSRGDDQANKILSQKRADAIMNALIENGVSSTKLTAIGRGEQNPIASNMYKLGREKNRRIEIELIK